MLKFEINEYNPSVLRHLSAALLAISVDCAADNAAKRDVLGGGSAGSAPQVFQPAPTPDFTAICPPPIYEGGVTPPPVFGPSAPTIEPDAVHIISPSMPPLNTVVGQVMPHVEEQPTLAAAVPPPPPEQVYGGVAAGGPAADPDADFPDPPGASNLDTNGIPWDARIHAATKTKCKDGSWKNKPGVDAALLASVTAELKGVQAIPTPTPPTATAAGPVTFAELIKALTPLLTSKRLTADQVNEQCQTHGLPNCNALAGRVDLIPTVWSQICLIAG